jgi:hypothetical protein
MLALKLVRKMNKSQAHETAMRFLEGNGHAFSRTRSHTRASR